MKIFAKAFAAFLCSLLLWEGLLRLFIVRPVPYHSDPIWGWIPVAHSSGMQNIEGYGTMHYNTVGYREDEVSAKTDHEIRIVALGDSYVEGRQVSVDQTFPRKLQTLLQNQPSCTDRTIRVFNGGRDGTTPAYSAYVAGSIDRLFQPDWVIFLVRDGGWSEIFNPNKEVFYREEGNRISFGTAWQSQTMARSRLRRVITTLHIRDLALYTYTQTKLAQLSGKPTRDNRKPSDGLSEEKQLEQQMRGIDWTLQQIQKHFKARAVIVHFPSGTLEVNQLLPPSPLEQHLAVQCRRRGIAFIPLRKYIVSDFSQTQIPPTGFANTLPWTGHPNAHGHALIARALLDFFTPRLCSDTPNGATKAPSADLLPDRK